MFTKQNQLEDARKQLLEANKFLEDTRLAARELAIQRHDVSTQITTNIQLQCRIIDSIEKLQQLIIDLVLKD